MYGACELHLVANTKLGNFYGIFTYYKVPLREVHECRKDTLFSLPTPDATAI